MADKRRSVVKELIKHQENAAFGQTETLISQLEKEIRDLRGRDDEMRKLSSTEDNIYFLQVNRFNAQILQFAQNVWQNYIFDFVSCYDINVLQGFSMINQHQ